MTSWVEKNKYPIDLRMLEVLVRHAQAIPSLQFGTFRKLVAGDDLAELLRQYNLLRGNTVSPEGLFGILPAVRRQAALGQIELDWFGKAAAYYRAASDFVRKNSKDSNTAFLATSYGYAADEMTGILRTVREKRSYDPSQPMGVS